MNPWCCWPPERDVDVAQAGPLPVAWGILDTNSPPGASFSFGFARIISTGVAGRVQLELIAPIAEHELIAVGTGLAPAGSFADVITVEVKWLDSLHIELQTYDNTATFTKGVVRLVVSIAVGLATPPTLLTPLEILDTNLAVWLQGDLGTGAGPNVTTWVNQAANGNAVQGGSTLPPTLATFGNRSAVRFGAGDQGLVLTLAAPIAIGDRPYTTLRARLTALVHTPLYFQSFYILINNPPGTNDQQLVGNASGTFDAFGYWDSDNVTFADGLVETFLQVPDLDLLPHTFQKAFQQTGSLVVDGVSVDAPSPNGAVDQAISTITFGSRSSLAQPLTSAFLEIGVFVMSFTQPTAPQIAALKAWCDAYG